MYVIVFQFFSGQRVLSVGPSLLAWRVCLFVSDKSESRIL